ncbi:hypothetical protein K435DRAFT_799570 [Dendrothele bispora CBS 962.96]|uniref:Uncharacterized protein n=1 Tax=Dendrothele bispora (strain CBS 962.96) TaxID=1314807 RepID=A0A4S8LVG6_DENBC|nr:hypothetical protein K435DRAFT_799570 [Dendrothele bispora CBS 962.96]
MTDLEDTVAYVHFNIAKMEKTLKSELLTEGMTKEDHVLVGGIEDSNAPKPSMPICTFYPDTSRWTHKPKFKLNLRKLLSWEGLLCLLERLLATSPAGVSFSAGKHLHFSYADDSPSNKKAKTTMPQPQPVTDSNSLDLIERSNLIIVFIGDSFMSETCIARVTASGI